MQLGSFHSCEFFTMLPTIEQADLLLQGAESCNPDPWGDHCRTAAHCAEKIAQACGDLDADKAHKGKRQIFVF